MANLDPQLNSAPSKINHIHIMGICGTGMAALAGMLQSSGFTITGSDQNVYPPMSDFLADLGITVKSGYSKNNLEPRPDLVIVGNVITRKNEEAIHLAELAIPYLSFPQALSRFFINSRKSLVITGTHGKTTTCSILASALYHAELDPTFMIGGIVPEFGGNFRIGDGEYFVAEGDEYDTAFFDKKSKFLHYQPHIAVITSLEFDHADIFEDLQSIKRAFRKFVRLIPEDGLLIANFDDENVRDVISEARCNVQSYGLNSAYDWSLADVRRGESNLTSFTALQGGNHYSDIAIQLPGQHNCLNSLAVTAILHHIGVPSEKISSGLKAFSGVRRRQEIRGIEKGITVIDDFAHHPTAVRETLSALRMAYPDNRLVIVFEPRTNTSRRAIFQKDYVTAFDCSDVLCIREPVPLTNVAEDNQFSSAQLARDINETRERKAMAFNDTDAILSYLSTHLESGDIVAILSNGGFDNIHNRLIEILRNR
ncbi:UDP-N-acetylmuramate:L-alanyl-gamma-D-glutamyl-meso-diaminopimelate ligase [Desulfosediminicola flagellatus]|uniref:UDP-N-acetylmuramate:L-alanyl-gamma-D-glutamyl- meso-diaminopimelate ligase n=1 Tax=Desulfosediminicola flagellatus TaxID=2569541 RepID=UPI0010ACECEE|nr:UDP-N-acetylmuramate:L-alanyl-gamma-D-glutamyl-meso-diaminopimelate ligase [Desulfosediminicola flagellatus]